MRMNRVQLLLFLLLLAFILFGSPVQRFSPLISAQESDEVENGSEKSGLTDEDVEKNKKVDNDAELKEKVESLLLTLDSDDAIERNRAEKELIALGPGILKLLKSAPGELGQRIDRIRNTLERVMIDETSQPSRVTLKGTMTAAAAFSAIAQQTGNQFLEIEDRAQEIELNLNEVTFWEAVDTVCDQAKLTIDDYGGRGEALQVIARSENAPDRKSNATYKSIFRLSPARVSLARNLENPDFDAFRVTMRVAWEPRLKPINLSVPFDSLVVKDDVGEIVEPLRAEGTVGTSVGEEPSLEITLPLELPDPIAESIRVSGKVQAVVAGGIETFEFKNIENPRKQKIERGQVVVELEGMAKNQDLYGARIRVRFEDSANSLESHRGWIYSNEAYLLDSEGRKVEALGMEMYRQRASDIGLSYLFDLQELPDGMTLIYRSPAAIVTLPVEFDLEKIVLP